MKKYYYVVIAIITGLWLSSCSKADDLAGSGDVLPAVTIFLNDIPASADPDVTVNLLYIPNSLCDKFYVLIEKKADKEAFITANGLDAYRDRVVSNGTQYSDISTMFDDTLSDTYAITAVGVAKNGTKGNPNEFIFNGINYALVGTAYYSSSWFNADTQVSNLPTSWYKSTNIDPVIYKLVVDMGPAWIMGPAWTNYMRSMKLNWNSDGKLAFYNGTESPRAGYWMYPTPFGTATYGAYWQEIDLDPEYTYYDFDDNEIWMDTRRVVAVGTFAGWFPVYIKLPPLPW